MSAQKSSNPPSDDALSKPVEAIKGVGPRLAKQLCAKGLTTIEELLFNLPLGYLDQRGGIEISGLRPGDYVSFVATVLSAREVHYRRRRIYEAIFTDGTGTVTGKWFHYGRWLSQRFPRLKGKIRVSGRLRSFGRRLEIHHPELEEVCEPVEEERGTIVPRYSPIPGVAPRAYRRIIEEVLTTFGPQVEETLPDAVRDYFRLPALRTALVQVHFPTELPSIENRDRLAPGLRRLIFEELFFLELQIIRSREVLAQETGHPMTLERDYLRRIGKLLPFALTQAQKRVMREIASDLGRRRPMNRLVQGDVGCGKTAVALLTAFIVIANGFQAAVMAPTEILAHQHCMNMSPYAEALGIPLTLLTSKLNSGEKQRRRQAIASGNARLVVGTHALIQAQVTFARLGLVIIDEQHRFGVIQRMSFRQKGGSPHVLVMTATPIPRTLAMTIYGDLDVSVIDELPPGRTPVETRILDARNRRQAYELLRQEFSRGHQGYIIYPLVEESDKSDLKDVTSMADHLQKDVFPKIRLAMLHGRMVSEEKQEVMTAFARKEIQLLVATTVIEVGIHVADATVMVIEHPERFGLSQLHQLRGRVGRGPHRSYCILMHQGGGPETRQRLAVMEQSNDGFRIAEEDLRLRGPGDLAGLQQAGFGDLRLANLVRDVNTLEAARRAALALMQKDPDLAKPAHAAIRAKLQRQRSQAAELLRTS
ncbi:MAG: ATP-dependent DNA helicase RecG [Deltaproteobacteria bacterium]|nr:MAG: ATP-dependent DNA helicase RecG [Deltaproteobacteria bacterium]